MTGRWVGNGRSAAPKAARPPTGTGAVVDEIREAKEAPVDNGIADEGGPEDEGRAGGPG